MPRKLNLTPEEMKARLRARALKWYHDHKHMPEYRERKKLARKLYILKRYEQEKNRHRRRKIERAGRPPPDACEACGGQPNGQWKVLVFDHCHRLGHFRGWICDRCNRTLGKVEDDVRVLRALIEYLERDARRRLHVA